MKFWVVSVGHDPTGEQLMQCSNSIDFGGAHRHIVIVDGAEYNHDIATSWRYVYYNKGRNYAARNITLAIAKHEEEMVDDDVICLVDLDDRLLLGAMDTVKAAYDASPSILLTYGSYVCASGRVAKFCKEYRPGTNVRSASWWGSHLKTFKYKLWKHLPLGCLLDGDGLWIQYAGDLAIMFALMELAGLDRCKFIEKPIYWYNDENPENEHKVDRRAQIESERWIRSREPFRRLEKV